MAKQKLREKPVYKVCECGRTCYSRYEYKNHICKEGETDAIGRRIG